MNRHRAKWAVAVSTVVALASCKSCESTRPDPRALLSSKPEAVIEVADVGVLIKKRDALEKLLLTVVTGPQLRSLQDRMERQLGFDPTTKEGLAQSGLQTTGAVAVEVTDAGRGALWVLPVADAAKFTKLVEQLASARANIDDKRKTKLAGRDGVVMSTSWGEEKVPVATVVVDRGLGVIGLGRRSEALVTAALKRSEATSVLANTEYQAIDKALGNGAAVRFIVPTATAAASRLAGRDDLGKGALSDAARSLTSTGWTLDFDGGKIVVNGRIRADENGRARIRRILKPKKAMPPAVGAAAAADALVVLNASGDPLELLAEVAPAGSAARAELDRSFARFNTETGLDVEKAVVPHLTGHAAVVARVRDLSGVTNLRAVMANPAALLGLTAVVGTDSSSFEPALATFMSKVDEALSRNKLTRNTRKVGAIEISTIMVGDQMLVETAAGNNVWVLSNDDKQAERISASAAGADPLAGQGGLRLEVRLPPLVAALRAVDISRLAGEGASAIVVRSMIAKALDTLGHFDRAEVSIAGASDGLAIHTQIDLAQPKK